MVRFAVVEDLYVFKVDRSHLQVGLVLYEYAEELDLALAARPERLDRGIVIGVAARPKVRGDLPARHAIRESWVRILRSPIRAIHELLVR